MVTGCNILNTVLELGRPESYSVVAAAIVS